MRLGRAWVLLVLCIALVPGCVGTETRGDRPTPEQLARRRVLGREAQDAIDREDWESARLALCQLLAEMPGAPDAHYRLGKVYAAVGDLRAAEASYRAALERDPDYADALCGLAQVETRQGRQAEALEHIRSAAEIAPGRAETHQTEGQIQEALGRADDALAAYFRALSCDPDDSEALVRIALIQLARGQYDQSLTRLARALEIRPGDPEIRYERGRAHLALGEVDRAIEDYQAAAQAMPHRSDVYLALALALEQARRPAEALQAVRHAQTLAPTDAAARELADRLRR